MKINAARVAALLGEAPQTYTETAWSIVEKYRDDVLAGEAAPLWITTRDVRRMLVEKFPDLAASFTDEDVRQVLRLAAQDARPTRTPSWAIAKGIERQAAFKRELGQVWKDGCHDR